MKVTKPKAYSQIPSLIKYQLMILQSLATMTFKKVMLI